MRNTRPRGVQGEVLASLALVMLTATGLLAVVLLKMHADQMQVMRELVAQGLFEQTRAPAFSLQIHGSGVHWWIASPATGHQRALGGSPEPAELEAEDWELAATARQDAKALIVSGAPWQPIRFAAPLDSSAIGAQPGEVAVARIPPAVSGSAVVALLLFDSGIFSLLGVHLLRRRVVEPLRRLSAAARSLSAGGFEARAPLEGVGEVSDLAAAFNEMSEALERRTNALEKAVKDLREANAQLRQARAGLDRAERLAAVGRLAAGVAHEVGNPMGAILAFLDLARRDDSLSEVGARHLERAAEQGERVREILRQLLDFSRPPRATRNAIDLAHCAKQVIGLVSAQRRYAGIEISLECEAPLAPVVADESMVSQVLLNLVLNAADAVESVPGPRIDIRLRPAALRSRAGELQPPGLRRADAVECSVRDNGSGIADEDRDRIFDPFFTTKAPGEGTGLGLANAIRLVEELEGVLELGEPDASQGACFRLRLPAAQSDPAQSVAGQGEPGQGVRGA